MTLLLFKYICRTLAGHGRYTPFIICNCNFLFFVLKGQAIAKTFGRDTFRLKFEYRNWFKCLYKCLLGMPLSLSLSQDVEPSLQGEKEKKKARPLNLSLRFHALIDLTLFFFFYLNHLTNTIYLVNFIKLGNNVTCFC